MLTRTRDALSQIRALGGAPRVARGSTKGDVAADVSEGAAIPWLPPKLLNMMCYAGIAPRQVYLSGLALGAIFVLSCGAAWRFGAPACLLFLPVALACEWLRLRRRIFLRAESFERDYTALLLSLASFVRTGEDPLVALGGCRKLFAESSELRKQLDIFQKVVETGSSDSRALEQFGRSIDHPDIELFRTVLKLSSKEGCPVTASLHRLARVTRQRQSFRRKLRAAVAMQKLSAFGIAGCVLVVALLQWRANPAAIEQALAHSFGQKLLAGGALLISGGIIWMLKISRVEI